MTASAALTPLVDLVFPPRCPLCGDALAEHGGLCASCWEQLAFPGEPACTLCQRPLGDSAAGVAAPLTCAPCLADPPQHDGIAAATLYTDASRALVLGLKHGRRIGLATLLGRLVAARLGATEGEWLVIPVPLHRWRLWRRGFNQSVLIGREVARATGRRLVVDGLLRTKATPPLGGLGRAERARMLRSAIVANPARGSLLAGAQVILVDDVITSGATTGACIAALRRAGARAVRIACFARVLDEALPHA